MIVFFKRPLESESFAEKNVTLCDTIFHTV